MLDRIVRRIKTNAQARKMKTQPIPDGFSGFTSFSDVITRDFVKFCYHQYKMDHDGVHGVKHWLRVLDNARMLASVYPDVDLKVLEAFALLHDTQRLQDYYDPDHGYRAAEVTRIINKRFLRFNDHQIALLCEALSLHSDGFVDADPTIQCCWDADRLDLGRVGIIPSAQYLCTDFARNNEVIEKCYQKSLEE